MRATYRPLAATFLGLTSILPLGCGDSTQPTAQMTGAIEISVSTASNSTDIDPDGYALSIDGQPGQAIGVNAMLTIGTLIQGTHFISLDGVASNCLVTGLNPRPIYVWPNQSPWPVTFSVSCSAKGGGGEGGWDY